MRSAHAHPQSPVHTQEQTLKWINVQKWSTKFSGLCSTHLATKSLAKSTLYSYLSFTQKLKFYLWFFPSVLTATLFSSYNSLRSHSYLLFFHFIFFISSLLPAPDLTKSLAQNTSYIFNLNKTRVRNARIIFLRNRELVKSQYSLLMHLKCSWLYELRFFNPCN